MGTRLRVAHTIALVSVMAACGGGGESPAVDAAVTDAVTDAPGIDAGDPPSTVTTVLRRQGFGPHCLDFESGAVTTCPCSGCAIDITLDAAGNFSGVMTELVSIGPVPELASVTALPSSGYTASAAAIVGDGYVLRTRDRNYYRAYVERYILEAGSGGVIGLSMKWAPYDCSLYASYRCDPIVVNASGVTCSGLYPDSDCDYAACAGEYLDCDSMRDNGCEVNGNVGVRCSQTANAVGITYTCAQGCDYGSCAGGCMDCDSNRMNGCEVVVASRCAAIANATPTFTCQTSLCDYTTCNTGYHDCDSDRSNGCELQGIGCPITMASGGGGMGPNGVSIDATSVFYVATNQQGVDKVPLAGGTPAQVVNGFAGLVFGALRLDASNVYFVAGGSVIRVAKSGGAGVELRPSPGDTPSSLVIDGTHAYFALNRGACCGESVRRVPLAGGGPEQTLADGPYFPVGQDASNIYVANGTSFSRIPKAGGAPVLFVATSATTYALTDATYLYWTSTGMNVVQRAPLAGGPAETILTSSTINARALAVDATHVYFADTNSGGLMRRVPLGGGSVEVLASEQGAVGGIAVDATHVYWTSNGTGRMVKLAK